MYAVEDQEKQEQNNVLSSIHIIMTQPWARPRLQNSGPVGKSPANRKGTHACRGRLSRITDLWWMGPDWRACVRARADTARDTERWRRRAALVDRLSRWLRSSIVAATLTNLLL